MYSTFIAFLLFHTILSKCSQEVIENWQKKILENSAERASYLNILSTLKDPVDSQFSVLRLYPIFSVNDLVRLFPQRTFAITFLLEAQVMSLSKYKVGESLYETCSNLNKMYTEKDEEEVMETLEKMEKHRTIYQNSLNLLDSVTDAYNKLEGAQGMIECFNPSKTSIFVRQLKAKEDKAAIMITISKARLSERIKVYSDLITQLYWLHYHNVVLKTITKDSLNVSKKSRVMINFNPFNESNNDLKPHRSNNMAQLSELIAETEFGNISSKSILSEEQSLLSCPPDFHASLSSRKDYESQKYVYEDLRVLLLNAHKPEFNSMDEVQEICREFWILWKIAEKNPTSEAKIFELKVKFSAEAQKKMVCGSTGRLII